MTFFFGPTSKKRMEGMDSRLVEILNKALEISNVDFGVALYGGTRTEEEQHKLFLDGKSNLDGKHKRSKHQDGLAVDLFAHVNGLSTWDNYYLFQVACAMLQAANELGYKLAWGGFWRNPYDPGHFELVS